MSEEILTLINESPFLGSLPDKQAQQLASIASIHTFHPGDAIVTEGSTDAMTMWIVVSGEVEVRKGDTPVATMGRGAHIGEMALFADSGSPRTAGVYAKSDTSAFRVAKWDLVPLIEQHPAVAMAVIQELARRLERTTAALG
jgi:CRP-like cAMP-binding protein